MNKRGRNTRPTFEIVPRNNYRYYEYTLPKGAIIGHDKYGIFACKDVNIGKRGTKNGYPCVLILRPIKETRNQIKWGQHMEHNPMTKELVRFYQKNQKKCVIRPKSKNEQAREVSRGQELRPNYDEVHYVGRKPYTPNTALSDRKTGRTTIEITIGTRTLEDIANEQRGNWVYTGTMNW